MYIARVLLYQIINSFASDNQFRFPLGYFKYVCLLHRRSDENKNQGWYRFHGQDWRPPWGFLMIVLLAPKICCGCSIETCQGKVTTLLDSKLICHNNGMYVVGKFSMVIRKRRLGVAQALLVWHQYLVWGLTLIINVSLRAKFLFSKLLGLRHP